MTSLTKGVVRQIPIVHGGQGVTYVAPNRWIYQLPTAFQGADGDQIALQDLAIYYSWRNVTALIGNNTFGYYWNVAGVQTLFTLVLQDGAYSYSDITSALKLFMNNNGHYLLDASANPVYYIDLIVNPALYSVSFTSTPVPAVLPTNYTNPNSITLGGNGAQLVIPASFAALSGFPAGTYPSVAQNTLYQINSQNAPQITQQPVICVACNLACNSGLSLGSSTIATFSVAGRQSGELINLTPNYRNWQMVRGGRFETIEITVVDQSNNPVQIYDPSGFVVTIQLCKYPSSQ